MIRINQVKMCIDVSRDKLKDKVAKMLGISIDSIENIKIIRRSLDARKKPQIMYVYCVDVSVKNEKKINKKLFGTNILFSKEREYSYIPKGTSLLKKPIIVVGMGPAGLFCAYQLAKFGYNPIVLERGKRVEDRTKDVEHFWETGKLDTQSNVQFGEGGAGTFSDGKLNTQVSDKSGRNQYVLNVFAKFGADESITYINKPHIGTDILSKVVVNMRNEIIKLGGEVRFESQVTDLHIENNKIKSVIVNNSETIECDAVITALGHSARDTFEMMYGHGLEMQAKNFSVGVRIEHLQKDINKQMYGVEHCDSKYLGAADYKLTGQASNGRSVFSFCMCPGGYVVNASSQEEQVAINGMSYSKRDSANANSAIIVSVTPNDYPNDTPLGGIEFQRNLEIAAYTEGDGNIPVQLFGDFCNNKTSTEFGEIKPMIKGKTQFGNLRNIFPEAINEALEECIKGFDKKIKNFARRDAVMSGVESRTSSPIRIVRDDSFESNIKGIFPCGEGAGYAGGITSASMDGIKVAEAIMDIYVPHKK
ncbi:MAG: FAD-dependent oxidoreductase [Clostridiales bacterium]|nr:FAD-dependent oxidoreductase [Clostridiales bacterium]